LLKRNGVDARIKSGHDGLRHPEVPGACFETRFRAHLSMTRRASKDADA
jgi:hypothetical protein